MFYSRNLLLGKRKDLYGLILLSFISVIFGFGLDIIFRYVCLVLST